MKTIKVNKDEDIINYLSGTNYLYLSDGCTSLHIYASDLIKEFGYLKKWRDVFEMHPKIVSIYKESVPYDIILAVV